MAMANGVPVRIHSLTANHHHSGFAISSPLPRLSWKFESSTAQSWKQASYKITIKRARQTEDEHYHIDSGDSVLVPWPSDPLKSREKVDVAVKVTGIDGSQTNWTHLTIEVALLEASQWKAKPISCAQQPLNNAKRPYRLRKEFECPSTGTARLYATALGLYEVEINGHVVGDQVLAPGWQSYKHRLHYQTYDVTSLLRSGSNVIGAYISEGWYSGRLGRPGTRNIWGSRPAFLAQLELAGEAICVTDHTWDCLDGPVTESEIYDGEVFDTNLDDPTWSTTKGTVNPTSKAEVLEPISAELVSPEAAPVRRIMTIEPVSIITTPKGKRILDFGQNLVGWVKINTQIPRSRNSELVIRHAEVLEHGELGTRPLRTAMARSIIKLGGDTMHHEPRFTFFGFRYAGITGFDTCEKQDFTAVVVASDLRRTGYFKCSHEMINKLHQNTVWSMRGNFLSVPTDCPQRDERLGWTGDLQVFGTTANYLFDTSAFLQSWLQDLEADQKDLGGVVPTIVPRIPLPRGADQRPMAVWADSAITVPWDLYNAFGDFNVLTRQWESMIMWLDQGLPKDHRGFYDQKRIQYGDWLDPRAPPHLPGHGPTDPFLIANAYLIHVTKLVAEIAQIIGKTADAERYMKEAERLLQLYQDDFITPTGRMASNTQAAYAIALHFELYRNKAEIESARSQLEWLTKWELFKITTGFAATPIILDTLAENELLTLAYRMLQEQDTPSWLYPVSNGATTIWERWNSMLPDGSINPGQMTSFNHYALGSVCSFLHATIGGLSSSIPGWKEALVKPRPGGTIAAASTSFDSPYGLYSVAWTQKGDKMETDIIVPPNGGALVILPGVDTTVGSGCHHFETAWTKDQDWPPMPIQGAQWNVPSCEYIP